MDGDYLYASRTLRNDESVIEILAYTANGNSDMFNQMSARIQEFVLGLELVL